MALNNLDAKVSFRDISKKSALYYHSKYFPKGFMICDPLRLKEIVLNAIVSHWHEQAKTGKVAF